MRILSLLPSATEMVCGLGLREYLVGVTHECDFPEGVGQLRKVTQSLLPPEATSQEIDSLVREQFKDEPSLYKLDVEALVELNPDLIVTQSLCGVCAVPESQLQHAVQRLNVQPQILSLNPHTLVDVFESLLKLGQVTGGVDRACTYVDSLKGRVQAVRESVAELQAGGDEPGEAKNPNVLMLEWLEPPFSAGHWNPELIELAGGRALLGIAGQRSRTITWEEIAEADPDVMVIACCGFDVQRTMREFAILETNPIWNSLRCVQMKKVHVLDGSAYFNRPGPRLVDSLELLARHLHPDLR